MDFLGGKSVGTLIPTENIFSGSDYIKLADTNDAY